MVWTARIAGLFVQIGGSNDRDRADLLVALFSIAQMVTSVAATLGLLWIEVRKMQATLERIAFFDPLTGVPNRRATSRGSAKRPHAPRVRERSSRWSCSTSISSRR